MFVIFVYLFYIYETITKFQHLWGTTWSFYDFFWPQGGDVTKIQISSFILVVSLILVVRRVLMYF